MDDKKGYITDGEDEMLETGCGISSQQPGEPIKLDRFVYGKAGQQRADAHDDNAGISNLLSGIVFYLWRLFFSKMEVVQQHKPGIFQCAFAWDEIAPFTGENSVEQINEAIQKEKPHDDKVKGHSLGEMEGHMQEIVERIRKELEQSFVAKAETIDIICPVNEQATPNHDAENGKVEPVVPA